MGNLAPEGIDASVAYFQALLPRHVWTRGQVVSNAAMFGRSDLPNFIQVVWH